QQGIYTGVVTLNNITNGNTAAGLETYINNAYATWDIPPVAILVLGDYGTNIASSVISPIYDSYCVSDNMLGDVDGDHMPDIVMARMAANNATELQTMISKFLNYERNPPTSVNFYDHPITALGWQDDRWFQLGSEVVGGYFRSLGKNPVRINALGSPASNTGNNVPNTGTWSTTDPSAILSYFGPTGLNYIPTYPGTLGGFSGGTPAQVVTAINSGSFILQHRDHGLETGWGEPAFDNTNISSLTNTGLTFIMSINCLTGKYNYSSECFAEKFHRYKFGSVNSGALGLIAASEVSYSFVNDTYIWGMYDNLWPNFMPAYGTTPASRGILPAFGNAAGKYFLQASSWPYNTSNKEVTYNLFHMHGDAFQTVYSEVPLALTVVHNATIVTGATSFNVSANAGSLICLSLNGVILGTATGTGSAVSITIPGTQVPPDKIRVVVTKQNYNRYEGDVLVIAPSGPFIVNDNVVINDATGNNNGLADFGENITLNVTLENVGISIANNVVATLSETDPFVVITDNSANFGNINASAVSTVNGAYAFHLADSVPDGHLIAFTLSITDGTNNWTGYFNVLANAPALTVTNTLIEDPTGNNNGRLDPGENTNMKITTGNIGHSNITGVQATLTTTDPNVTITGSPQSITAINAGASQIPSFGVNVSAAATIGEVAMFIYTAQGGDYKVVDTIYQIIGLVSEDWETGNFTKFAWVNNSAIPWTITTAQPYEGTYCAQSGAIGDQETTSFQITLDVVASDSISFYRKISSEANYDYLRFYIDGAQQDEWAGTVAWGRAVYHVTVGQHIFKWTYEKDYNTIGGSDKVWVDYILFPPINMPVSVNEIVSDGNWQLYPNPNNGQFILTGNALSDETIEISIFNSIGMCVYKQNNVKMNANSYSIELPNAAAGMYLLKINGNKTQTTLPVIVK
ncbi:MAG: C25 family cysteine peptidase, partial [Bacteroidota bacterium]